MKLHFGDWVYHYGGVKVLSKELNCTTHVVRIWVRGGGCPTAKTFMTLIKLSKKTLTFEQIYKETTRNLKTKVGEDE